MAEEPVEVVIVDDHPVFREGLRAVVQSDSVLRVVGEYADGLTAATAIEELQPDVVLMDLNLPGLTGVEATRRVAASSPHAAVLVLTMVDEGDSVFAAMRAGARGYLLKGAVPEEILRGVHAVARGEVIFGPGVAERVRRFFTHPRSGIGAFPELTSREGEVLELIAAGSSNPDIARKLFISPKTVRNHISNIFAKLQVADRAEAVELARGAGLGRGD